MSTSKEIEVCYIVEIKNSDALDKAVSIEEHEQYEHISLTAEGEKRGKSRVRKTTKNDAVEYTMTLKTQSSEDDRNLVEETVTISQAYYDAWKKVYATSGQNKTRYTFVVDETTLNVNGNEVVLPKLKYEFDVLRDKNGKRGVYAKLDIEVQSAIEYVKQNFPDLKLVKFNFDFSNVPVEIGEIYDVSSEDEAVQSKVKQYFEYFSIPYSYVGQPKPAEQQPDADQSSEQPTDQPASEEETETPPEAA